MVPWTEIRLSEGAGEIEARGPWVAARYYEDPSGDDKFTDDGWLRTGDIGELDEQGFVRITDRAKDLIKSGGEWISSVEVETLLIDHPAVVEAAVIAMPDEKWGERPLACVALAEGAGVSTRRPARAPVLGPGAVAAARRLRLHRRGAQDERGQVRQEGSAPGAGRWRAGRRALRGGPQPTAASARKLRTAWRDSPGRQATAAIDGSTSATRTKASPGHAARSGDRLGDHPARPPDARGLEELVDRPADRADARRPGAVLGGRPERAPHRVGVGVHPRLVGDLRERDLLAAGQGMRGGQRDVARLAGDLVQLERGREGRADDGHVGLAGRAAPRRGR